MRPDGDEPDDLERTSLLGDDPHRSAWSAAAVLRSMVSRLPRRISRWRPTRVRRVGLVRGGLATLTALVAVVVVLQASGWRWPFARGVHVGGDPVPITASEAAPTMTFAGYAPRPTGSGGWEQLALPLRDGATLVSEVTASADPQTLYACTRGQPGTASRAPPEEGELRVWRTRDAGLHWTTLALPHIVGWGCQLAMARDAASRIALLVTRISSDVDSPGCSTDALYLSNDAGTSWMRVNHATLAPVHSQCSLAYWPTAHHLFVETTYSYYVVTGTTPISDGVHVDAHQVNESAFERSDDEGRTWERADEGIAADGTAFGVWQTDQSDTLLASVSSAEFPNAPYWRSRDAGRTWQHLAFPIEQRDQPVNPDSASLERDLQPPVYGYTNADVFWRRFDLQVAQAGADGRIWRILPSLTVPGVDATHTGLFHLLGTLPDARLLVLGATPEKGIPPREVLNKQTPGIPSEWFALWAWDPRATPGGLEQLSGSLSRQGVSGVGKPSGRVGVGDGVDGQAYRLR